MERAWNEMPVRILTMSTVLKPSNDFALLLQETIGKRRRIALIIGPVEAQHIRVAQLDYKVPRPLTHDLMVNVIREGGLKLLKGVITAVKDGIYFAQLYIRRADGTIYQLDARSSDVISLSLRDGFPLYVMDEVLEKEQLYYYSPEDSMYSIPFNMVNTKILKRELEIAVEREDYERASELRDEIRRREADPPGSEHEDLDFEL